MASKATLQAAIDLGASSARVMLGRLEGGALVLAEVARVPNGPVRLGDGLHWDVDRLFAGILEGLASLPVKGLGALVSVGVDGWGGDYGLLDAEGQLIGPPFHYRDGRTATRMEQADQLVGLRRIYEATGEHTLRGNTLYQLLADRESVAYGSASQLLMIPDLFAYLLSGERRCERTIASTTQLVDARTGLLVEWLVAALGLRRDLFAPAIKAGQVLGELLPEVAAEVGMETIPSMVAVASHDTASAVLAIPARCQEFAFVSSGTWSLVGLELEVPVITEEGRKANFANELGANGSVLFRKNVMGHWMLQECQRAWSRRGHPVPLDKLLNTADRCPPFRSLVDTADPAFAEPGDMPARIVAACKETGEPVPSSRGEVVRCVLDSMALAIAEALREAQQCSNREVRVVHMVGGGAANNLLTSLVSATTGLELVAGPVEASSLGNLLVQLQASGQISGSEAMRALVERSFPSRRLQPDPELTHMAALARSRWSAVSVCGHPRHSSGIPPKSPARSGYDGAGQNGPVEPMSRKVR